jgi:hypothetical protein
MGHSRLIRSFRPAHGHVRTTSIAAVKLSGGKSPDGATTELSAIHLSRFSGDLSLLILTDRAAPSYQLLDLSFAVLGAIFLIFNDLLIFGTRDLLSSFLGNRSSHLITLSARMSRSAALGNHE